MTPVLEVRDLSKSFGQLPAVQRVSLDVEQGEIRAIIGPNGAGKTTFFNLISGATRPDRGKVSFAGKNVTTLATHRRVKLGLSRTFQVPNVFLGLSVRENLRLGVEAAYGLSRYPWLRQRDKARVEARVEAILERLALEEQAHTLVSELAHGDQRVVEIGLALSLGAKLLLLDEPTAGMSDEETAATIRLIHDLWERENVTIAFIEHDMKMVFGIAHRITVLHLGEVLAEGTPEEIAGNEAVQSAYLGTEEGA